MWSSRGVIWKWVGYTHPTSYDLLHNELKSYLISWPWKNRTFKVFVSLNKNGNLF